ncbi:hypothetical protein BDZ45DRAFT_736779 [Acephala macrosclerotiorum]|nr:hypothetical protein BDZ45DRAFT_736779 [Acephala macrosclerotiorum]
MAIDCKKWQVSSAFRHDKESRHARICASARPVGSKRACEILNPQSTLSQPSVDPQPTCEVDLDGGPLTSSDVDSVVLLQALISKSRSNYLQNLKLTRIEEQTPRSIDAHNHARHVHPFPIRGVVISLTTTTEALWRSSTSADFSHYSSVAPI